MAKMYFEINAEKKQFVFSEKNYKKLFEEGSAVNKAFKAAMALGCYEGFTPVQAESEKKATKGFNEAGVISWIELNNPEYMATWEAMKKVKTASNEEFGFMVRKNLFLFDNPAARVYAGMDDKKIKKTKEHEAGVYTLTPNAIILQGAVKQLLSK